MRKVHYLIRHINAKKLTADPTQHFDDLRTDTFISLDEPQNGDTRADQLLAYFIENEINMHGLIILEDSCTKGRIDLPFLEYYKRQTGAKK